MWTASSARTVWGAYLSGVEKTATVRRERARAARMRRTAISPRLAIRTFVMGFIVRLRRAVNKEPLTCSARCAASRLSPVAATRAVPNSNSNRVDDISLNRVYVHHRRAMKSAGGVAKLCMGHLTCGRAHVACGSQSRRRGSRDT